ncbi:MAG TPA: hypothetical protein VMI75_23075 [Polyangiaceae bacterium]|nr:hypothetical protein [Polyangiaceae bacterium]
MLETVARIVQLGGAPARAERVAALRASWEERTGAFSPEDPWFEERSRGFWDDAVTTQRFGRDVVDELTEDERVWLGPLERAHRGLFRVSSEDRDVLEDVWSGAELVVSTMDEASRAELDTSSGQLFDARVVGAEDPLTVALLPGAVFHSRDATEHVAPVLAAARARGMSTGDTLDALLRMQRALRSLSRVKPAYAYRAEALSPRATALPHGPVQRSAKAPT